MNLDLITPARKTEDFLLSVVTDCATLMKQTHTQPKETLKNKIYQTRRNFRIYTIE